MLPSQWRRYPETVRALRISECMVAVHVSSDLCQTWCAKAATLARGWC
jgi:hypothetical protein